MIGRAPRRYGCRSWQPASTALPAMRGLPAKSTVSTTRDESPVSMHGDPAASRRAAAALLERADAGTDLIVFPECSLTGYAPERAEELSLGEGNPYVAEIERKADELDSLCSDPPAAKGRFVKSTPYME